MLDFYGVIVNVILFLAIFLLLRPAFYVEMRSTGKTRIILSIVLAIVFCVYAYWAGDYHHMLKAYPQIQSGYSRHFEDVYHFVAHETGASYDVFRLIIWGMAISLIAITYKRLTVRWDLTLFFCFSFYLLYLSYARVSLAMATMFLGYSLMVKPVKRFNIFSFIVGITLIYSSIYFHHSALFGVAIISLSYILGKLKGRWKIFLLIASYPLMIFVAKWFLSDLYITEYDDMVDVAHTQRYLNGAELKTGLGMLLQNVLFRLPFYLFVYVFIKSHIDKTYKKIPNDVYAFCFAAFLIISSASIFLFDLGYNTYTIYYRFLNFAMIPSAVLISYYKSNHLNERVMRWGYLIGISASFYIIIYRLYQVSVS